MSRFKDTRETIYSFQNEFLLKCPRCNSCAVIKPINSINQDWFAPRRFSCKECGLTKNWAESEIVRPFVNEAVDDYFHYPLWLQIHCCDNILWAYNIQHLDFIEQFVAAKIRERKPDEKLGWSNQSLFSRLPKWIQSRKNRDDILKSIVKMRETLK